MTTFFSYGLFFILFYFPILGAKEVVDTSQALTQAKSLPGQGKLKKSKDGSIYLDISNKYITSIYPLLNHRGGFAPTTSGKKLGARILVFSKEDLIYCEEIGKIFSFQIEEITSVLVRSKKKHRIEKCWILIASAPELESLRTKYGKPALLNQKKFFILIGTQVPIAKENWKTCNSFSSWNTYEPCEGDFISTKNPLVINASSFGQAKGQLTLHEKGYLYLNTDSHFMDKILQSVPFRSYSEVLPNNGESSSLREHIQVISQEEIVGNELWEIEEIGEWFLFSVVGLRYVEERKNSHKERTWYLVIDAPALQRLRHHYGLHLTPRTNDFRITIAKEIIFSE